MLDSCSRQGFNEHAGTQYRGIDAVFNASLDLTCDRTAQTDLAPNEYITAPVKIACSNVVGFTKRCSCVSGETGQLKDVPCISTP